MSPTAGLSFSEGGKAVATITNIFDIQPVDCRVVGEAGWWRPRHNLSDWNRRHIPGSFCFCFGFDNESLFSDYPRQFYQLLIIHILSAGFFHFQLCGPLIKSVFRHILGTNILLLDALADFGSLPKSLWADWWSLHLPLVAKFRSHDGLWNVRLLAFFLPMYFIICSAMRTAWSDRHPDHQLHGCMFHMSQVA